MAVINNPLSCFTLRDQHRAMAILQAVDGVQEARGFEIKEAVRRSTGEDLPYGRLYSLVDKLRGIGLLACELREVRAVGEVPVQKIFKLTERGRGLLQERTIAHAD